MSEARRSLSRWRAETPLVVGGRIHLNNAGAAAMPRPVLDRVLEHLGLEAQLGGYEAADAASELVAETYNDVARLVHAAPRNIAVVENSTAATMMALQAFDFEPGDVLITTRNDYVSNQLMFLSLARRQGVRVVRAEDAPEGGVDPESIRRLVDEHRPRLVSVSYVPTNSGLVQPAEAVGEICEAADVPYLVDACQAVGQMEVDTGRLRCDFLAATARKFLRGPRGIGFLYISDRMLKKDGRYPLYVDLHGARWVGEDQFEPVEDARRFENWEFAYALVIGLGEAARYALGVGIETARARAWELAAYTRQRLEALDGARLLDQGSRLSAIVTAEIKGFDADLVVERLREGGINTSAARREFALLDMEQKGVMSALRISPHYYNTRDELDLLIEALEELIRS